MHRIYPRMRSVLQDKELSRMFVIFSFASFNRFLKCTLPAQNMLVSLRLSWEIHLYDRYVDYLL